jgi:plasmid stabilization system protein ParE
MTKPVRLSREAREELHEAARRYGEVRPELRTEFLAAIDEAMVRLVRMARHLGSPPGIDPALGVRRVFVERFPFSLYFVELPTRFRVLAVAHARRRPFYWRGR